MALKRQILLPGGAAGFFLLGFSVFCSAQTQPADLTALSAYQPAGKNWQAASAASVRLDKPTDLLWSKGEGILTATAGNGEGSSLSSQSNFGDIHLELDYMVTKGTKATLYLNDAYPIFLADNWGETKPSDQGNGGIPGRPPRQQLSRAPGLWQHLSLSFRTPRTDASGKVTAPATLTNAVLDGVLIHENITWPSSISGAAGKADGPLRISPVAGSIALRNIRVSALANDANPAGQRDSDVDPILVEANSNTTLRSFMDIPGQRVVHCLSAGSAEQVHYSYDLDNGYVFQIWRGGFLDATPMWHDRGDGSSRVLGSPIFLGKPQPAIAKLADETKPWPADTTGSGFFSKGYIMDEHDRPQFKYRLYGQMVTDALQALPDGTGLSRTIRMEQAPEGCYVLLAKATAITEQGKGTYLINGQQYYLQLDEGNTEKPIIREAPGGKELLIPIHSSIHYSLIF